LIRIAIPVVMRLSSCWGSMKLTKIGSRTCRETISWPSFRNWPRLIRRIPNLPAKGATIFFFLIMAW